MICANCGTDNEAGRKFCKECATPLALLCANCGTPNAADAKYCGECAAPLRGDVPTSTVVSGRVGAQPAEPVSERRVVTVMFADIVGFTPFAEERDAEDVRETLSRYFDLSSDVVSRYGGTIEKFIGDAVMAVWGAPVAHEDDAERAVRAALELVAAVPGLATAAKARAAVLTGEAAVTIGATNQGLVAGDLVNTASRLQSVAQPGTVLVGESAMRASSNAIAYESVGDQVLKGKQAPVAAWQAVRVVAELRGRNRAEGLEAPFVGRADELRLLKDLFHATGREQKARLVSVIGPAGIGKSRLAWEFLKYVDGLVETTYWHDGRSPAYGEGISFWALGEMIRGRAGLLESDDEPTTRQKVADTVAQWVTDADERQWIERALLALLGVESGLSPDALFAAWRTFFERISEKGTVTLVFEDLHFADKGLLDFIDHMLEWSRGRPIYIVTLARPDLLERRPDFGAGKRSFTSIYLEALSPADMRLLLAGLVPGLPEGTVAAIVARADGIPLYAVETVRSLVADGKLVERDGAYVPAGDLANLTVPDSLTTLIRARLDGLDAEDRSVVHDAAVIGQSFTIAALSAVSGTDADVLEPRLRGLVRRELLRQEIDARSPERGQYVFVQALIREVAYNTLSKRDRKTRHLAAARFFEQLGSDELAGALAGHYLAAQANAGEQAEADALAAQARIALKAAAERAATLGSFDLAVRFLEQAISISAEPRDIAELRERAGEAAMSAGDFDRALAHLQPATDIRLSLGDRAGAARTIAARGQTLLEGRRNQPAIELLEPAEREYADVVDPDVASHLKFVYARALDQINRHEDALRAADAGLEIAEHAGLLRRVAQLFITKAASLGSNNRLHESLALLKGAEELCRENGWDETLSAALTVTSVMAAETLPRRAWEASMEAVDIARRAGRRDRLWLAASNSTYGAFTLGEWDIAVALVDPFLAETDMDLGQRAWLLSNGIIVRAGRGEDVSALITEMDRAVAELDEIELRTAAGDAHANVALAAGDYAEAARIWRNVAQVEPQYGPLAHYQAARAALWLGMVDDIKQDIAATEASGLHGPVVDARLLTMGGGVAALEGRSADAINLFVDALAAWRALGLVWDETLTELDFVMSIDPAVREVAAAAAAARETLERLGAKPYLARLDAVIGRRGESLSRAAKQGERLTTTV